MPPAPKSRLLFAPQTAPRRPISQRAAPAWLPRRLPPGAMSPCPATTRNRPDPRPAPAGALGSSWLSLSISDAPSTEPSPRVRRSTVIARRAAGSSSPLLPRRCSKAGCAPDAQELTSRARRGVRKAESAPAHRSSEARREIAQPRLDSLNVQHEARDERQLRVSDPRAPHTCLPSRELRALALRTLCLAVGTEALRRHHSRRSNCCCGLRSHGRRGCAARYDELSDLARFRRACRRRGTGISDTETSAAVLCRRIAEQSARQPAVRVNEKGFRRDATRPGPPISSIIRRGCRFRHSMHSSS